MTVKLAILKSGEDIVADIKEMLVGEGDDAKVVGYFLTKPCTVSLNSKALKVDDDVDRDTYQLKLVPWCPLTKQDKIPITADWVVTIVCLLYTSDAADDRLSVDLGGRRIIK